MTQASAKRIKNIVDAFIRSDYVSNWTAEKDADFINESERAERCHKAAKFGADGKTHAEVIEDWREAWANMVRFKRFNRKWDHGIERVDAAVNAHFDAVEDWHDKHGSLFQEIG